MTGAALAAAAAAIAGVLAAWDLLGEAAVAPVAVRRVLAPLARVGEDGRAPSAAERRRLLALAMAVLAAGGWLVAGPAAALLLAAAAPLVLRAVVAARRRRRRARLLDAAPVLARALADALAGGHSVRAALAEAARGGGLEGPAAAELAAVARALELGAPTEEVLDRLRRRVDAPVYDTLVAAILLQARAGGDLAGLLRTLAASLEERARLQRDARAATAQARFTGSIVAGLPIGAAALAELAAPTWLAGVLSNPAGAAMLVMAATLQIGGLLAVRRLGRTGVAP